MSSALLLSIATINNDGRNILRRGIFGTKDEAPSARRHLSGTQDNQQHECEIQSATPGTKNTERYGAL
jgi:hypothetical protein